MTFKKIATKVSAFLLALSVIVMPYSIQVPVTYAAAPTDYISCWDLEETSGTRVDDNTTNSNDLTDNNTVLSAAGKNGTAADFEAANSEYLSITDATQANLDLAGDFSFATWANFESFPASFDYVLFSKFLNTGNQRAYSLEVFDDAGTKRFQGYVSANGSTGNAHRVAVTMSTATWYHIVFTYDVSAGTSEFFLNGSSLGTVSGGVTSIFNSSAEFRLSSLNGPSALFMDGLMDSTQLFDRVLTGAEITAMYNGGTGAGCDGVTGSSRRVINTQ